MSVCPSCGHRNQPGAKFCSECGLALAGARPPSSEERKIVTVLFADLVGFTSRAEQMDPEDVRALLSPFHARLRAELERFGGTVEKFIGDAVMALFGAPAAHEDDPARAVLAALAIRDWVRGEERIQVRLAVNTGEALVTLGARPAEGEGMAAGDVVNTTARLQTAAPVNGILVGERTFRATREVIEYRAGPPVTAKGKREPVPAWEAVRARGGFGARFWPAARTTLVGRDRELGVLRDALARAREERSVQLVTVAGVPGIGKSRLLYELWRTAGADENLITWRLGRSLPYGEGVTYWALAEMVKAQAGILESDTAAQAEAKLAAMTAEVVPGPADADWVLRHLRALAGLGPVTERGGAPFGGDRRGEAFAAWRYFVEALAESRPLVLVFEDLHWADDGLLDFVDHLADWANGVPLLLVGSARPELLERRPSWGGGKPNALTLSLAPLSDQDTARLISSLTGRPVLEAGQQAALLARAGGNPLYAEQYLQMLAERGAGSELPVPDSVQAIIGARLDLLAPADKRLLQDAAVVGKVFWPGAVAALGGPAGPGELEEGLHRLERKQFIRRERRSSVAGQTQYAFAHVLVRDVAYGQIPRAARAGKHLHAAGWIESMGRPDDHAEMLAHHYLSALDLARAANQDAGDLAPRARPALEGAGDRALALNAFAAAAGFYRAALDLWPPDATPQRAGLAFRLALALGGAGEDRDGAALERARSALSAAGDKARSAEAEARLAELWWLNGDRDRAFEHLGRAQDLVGGEPASAAKAYVLSELARSRMLADEFDARIAQEALDLAEQLGLSEVRAHVLITAGMGRQLMGDPGGKADIELGLELARAGNFLAAAVRGYANLATVLRVDGDLPGALRLALEADQVARRLGTRATLRWTRGGLIGLWLELGSWDKSWPAADEFLAESAALGPHYQDTWIRVCRSWMRLARGDTEGALADQRQSLISARQAKDPQVLCPALSGSAYVLAMAGRADEAQPVLSELFGLNVTEEGTLDESSVDCVLAAEILGRRDEMRRWLSARRDSPWFAAVRELADREFVTAAEALDAMGAARSAALARLRAGQELTRTGRRAEADEQLRQALGFFRSVAATRFIREAEALLAASA
ncbi:MAG TPA: AAA family ATPase [Streptosporangiaceae bacterium]|nr:AAA family ATPase [Streptosporangiaceae bacterium]